MIRSTHETSSTRSLISLAWQSVGYGIGIFGRQLVIYLTLPIFTNSMSQEAFGLVSFAIALMAFINTLTNAGLPAATYRFYYDSTDSYFRHEVLGSALGMFLSFVIIPAACLFVWAESVATFFLSDARLAPIIQLTALLLVVDTLINYGYTLLRIQMRPLATSISNILIVIVQMGFALLFVFYFRLSAIGYVSGLLLGGFVGLIMLAWLTRNIISFRISQDSVKDLLKYGLPLLPAALSMWALNLADRMLIGSILGLDQLAIYEVGYKIGALVTLAAAPFQAAWPPFAFATMHKTNAAQIYRDVLTGLLAVCLFCVLGLLAFKAEILSLLAPSSYMPALTVIGWVAVAKTFEASYVVTSIGSKISKRTVNLSIAAIFSAVIYLVLNLVLINWWGIQGAAVATMVGYLLLSFTGYAVSQYTYSFPLDRKRILGLSLATLCSFGLISLVNHMDASGWEYYTLKIVALLSSIPISLLLGVVTVNQLKVATKLICESLLNRIQPKSIST